MQERRTIIAGDIDGAWSQMLPDFETGSGMHDYHVSVQTLLHTIEVDIVSSPGGGYEGGYGNTRIHSFIAAHPGFVFVMYPEDFLNRIGKLFGLQDIKLGYKEFDDNVIVKTNNKEKLKAILGDFEVRSVMETLSGYSFKLDDHEDNSNHYLDLTIQRAVTDPGEFRQIFTAFQVVLNAV